ncbi:3-isopropylmalate dehydratase small subunit [Tessaracoccus sp. OH4464_COT-324]|uniref:3-isopropylmalate dehydratase small subunit n=1 Tax=Tessaracoccus sp. OH4464_COT-324 TaxID=2491059 RepID=UPI000F63A88E|nr:3-isopropylmalate dehydratase small subunit [Tessaracoccus sp. OH4464_COT-324]RRD47504.1 3-isopropylmalate dehydratase small subunit [Tessaracoccus sp. OH4464_COT-324]
MEKFSTHAGVPVPLRRSNVDTDQIIPAVYLKRITRTGFADGLFAGWRQEPDFVLNQEPFRSGTILVVGPDFGTGSSREHAVWALQDYGFKAVIGSRFGDIFRNNSGKAGLVVAVVPGTVVVEIWEYIDEHPGEPITVDLVERQIRVGDQEHPFELDDFTRHRLLEGLDDISMTLQHEEDIAAYEERRPGFLPKTLPARVAD